jgi:DtxR family Mn-dependent transcriptional regulator
MGVSKQTTSGEDYLKTIALLGKESKVVRVTEIGKMLKVKAASVTEALTKLSKAGLVKHQKYGGVELTAEGARIARDVNRRHEVLRRFLAEILNVYPEIAEQDACGMEHALSAASLVRMAKFVEFMSNCPLGTPECLKGFSYYFEHGERDQGLLTSCRKRDGI